MWGVRTLGWIRCYKRARSVWEEGWGVDFSLGWLSWSLLENLGCMRREYEVRVVLSVSLFKRNIINYNHRIHNVTDLRYSPKTSDSP